MTTKQQEALRLANVCSNLTRYSMDAHLIAAKLLTQQARITELEAQLEAIGAGGVSGPLIGQPQAMPDLSQLTERGAKAWAGVDAQGRPEGLTAADMATAAAQGFRDGVASLTAQAADLRTTFGEMLVDLPNTEPFTLFKAGFDAALAAGQATAAQAVVQDDLITIRKPTTSAEMLWLLKLAHLVISDVDKTLEAAFAPAQPAAEPSRFGSPELQAMIIARCVEKDRADSVPAVSDLPPLPAPDLRDVGTKPQEIKEFLKGYATEYARTAIAARAPAGSVQEDAARLDFLIEQRAYVVSDPDTCTGHWLHWARPDGSTRVQGDEHPTPRAAIDAARKQGEKQ